MKTTTLTRAFIGARWFLPLAMIAAGCTQAPERSDGVAQQQGGTVYENRGNDGDGTVVVPSGVEIVTRLNQQISTESARTGMPFTAKVEQPVTQYGVVAIPAGWTVRGAVTESEPAARVGGTAKLSLRIDEIVTSKGEIYALDARELRMQGESTAQGDVEKVLGGTVGGLVIGGILGGEEGAKKGAAGGAVAGGVYAVLTRGNDIVLPAGTDMAFILDDDVTLPYLAMR
ncbi:MAG: hypothetical protein R3E12_02310 [Candidatus Eisenbacteria bacterium]|uniref:TrbI/VirB10 family protein n=1 Tax=Eiseniibacteriota bacterium TaxID=2212470 RepID=A0A956M1R0_UNCEI|nr:hypothetical protein [Candidatus Eisenbacteria bacterium]